MIATLRFKLPEEATEHLTAVYAGKLAYALASVQEHLRSELKYGNLTPEARASLERVQAVLLEQELPEEIGG